MMKTGKYMLWSAVLLGLMAGVLPAQAEPKVALVMKALSNPFFVRIELGAKNYAKQHNQHIDSFGMERETNIENQIGIMESLIQKGYDGIVLAPADSVRLVPVVKKAVQAGIKVVNIDNPLDAKLLAKEGIVVPFVGPDNYAGSKLIGEYVKEKMGDTSYKVVYLEGIRGVANADLRRDGFKKGLKGSKAKIVASESANWHPEEAMTLVADWLMSDRAAPQVIACANDSMALGAQQGIEMVSPGMDQILVTGYDNVAEVRGQLRNGSIQATVEQHPEQMCEQGLALVMEMIAGEKPPKYVATPVDLITYETFGKKLAFTVSNTNNPFFRSMVEGVKAMAALYGMELTVVDAADDSARQLDTINQFVEAGADFILVNPTDTSVAGSGVQLANAAGIPVMTIDRNVMTGEVVSHVASDNNSGGRMAAEYLLKRLPQGGDVLELQGLLGTSAAHDRGMGFNAAMEGDTRYRIDHQTADFNREKAAEVVDMLLKSGHTYDAVFAHNDEMILGALDAMQANDSEALLIGFDATPEAVAAVQNGTIAATIAQESAEMGREAVRLAARFMRGFPVDENGKVQLRIIELK